MRTVQIYIGRQVTDIDCIRVTFTVDGQSQTVDVPRIDFLNGRPEYEYNAGLTEGDYIVTENGDYITTEDGDYLITESSIFTPSIYIYWDGTQWIIEITIGGVTYTYFSSSDVYYPYLTDWEVFGESAELEYLVTGPCTDLQYERLELFDDEKINITLNVQNLSDISKTFTDFSQSFTVPGSIVNNRIFEHFYQNDVDGTLDHNLKRPAYIEIDFIPFRTGVISLEKANMKNGNVDNYSITFFGNLTSLKNIFKEIKINQLDYSSLEFPYNSGTVYTLITDTTTDYPIRFPLIANNRLWTYADGGTNDITVANPNKAIQYTELFPAIKVKEIFNAIEAYFDITFSSVFFNDEKFTKLFLEAKNAQLMSFISEPRDLIFEAITSIITPDSVIYPPQYVDIANNSINVLYNPNNVLNHDITITRTSITGSGSYFIDVYKNGIFDQTFIGDNLTIGVHGINVQNVAGLNYVYTFKVRANTGVNVEFEIQYNISRLSGTILNYFCLFPTQITSFNDYFNIANYLPDIKVADFFSGILKQFNLTCVGVDQTSFQIEPLENWYNQGATIDVTKYIDSETADISKAPLFRNIAFKYQQSEAFTNRNYFKLSNSEYGNTNNIFNYDGGDFTIESPFENLLFTRSVGSAGQEAILGYFLNQNYQSYIPKPTLLYYYGDSGTLTTNIKLADGATYTNISSYILFGQDLDINGTIYSLNFGADNSIILNQTIQNSLFATYYFSYLTNLYDLKQRITTVKSMLPLSIITNLQLNDRLIIRDKRYIINDIKLELTSGEATLTLYNDFRDVLLGNVDLVDNGLNFVPLLVPYRNGNQSAIITSDPPTLGIIVPNQTWAVGNIDTKQVTLVVPINTTGLDRQWIVTVTYVNGTTQTLTVIQSA
jgi:hypothetical protein